MSAVYGFAGAGKATALAISHFPPCLTKVLMEMPLVSAPGGGGVGPLTSQVPLVTARSGLIVRALAGVTVSFVPFSDGSASRRRARHGVSRRLKRSGTRPSRQKTGACDALCGNRISTESQRRGSETTPRML